MKKKKKYPIPKRQLCPVQCPPGAGPTLLFQIVPSTHHAACCEAYFTWKCDMRSSAETVLCPKGPYWWLSGWCQKQTYSAEHQLVYVCIHASSGKLYCGGTRAWISSVRL